MYPADSQRTLDLRDVIKAYILEIIQINRTVVKCGSSHIMKHRVTVETETKKPEIREKYRLAFVPDL